MGATQWSVTSICSDLVRSGHRAVRAISAVAGLLGIFWATAASGYVPQGPHILEMMARNLAGAQSLTVNQVLTVDDPLVTAGPVVMNEEIYYLFPDQFRSEIRHAETRRILVVSHGEALTIVGDQIASGSEGRFDRYKDLLLYRSRKLVHLALLRNGVDVGVTSLGRMGDRLVYVIGAQYPDESVPQVWVDKERLLPVRWLNMLSVAGSSQPPDRLDFIYSRWQQLDGVWYPMRIESIYNGHTLRTAEVRRAEANKAIAGEMLSIAHLMSLYAAPDPQAPAEAGSTPEEDEVQRTIEEFKRKFDP